MAYVHAVSVIHRDLRPASRRIPAAPPPPPPGYAGLDSDRSGCRVCSSRLFTSTGMLYRQIFQAMVAAGEASVGYGVH